MTPQYKAGLVVLTIALTVFIIGRPVFRHFMSEEDFKLRRNAWLSINALAFISPSFWIYAIGAGLILFRAGRRDSNPAALYMFVLVAMAPIGLQIPTLGIVNQLFPLDHLRLLSLVVLLPMVLSRPTHRRSLTGTQGVSIRSVMDVLVISFCLIQVLLLLPYSSLTVSLRRSALLFLEVLLPYFALSRAFRSKPAVTEALACFSFSMIILAPIALMEVYWRSMMYSTLQEVWGTPRIYSQLLRSDVLRAIVTGGHSIVFGYCMAIGLIAWLSLCHKIPSRLWRWTGAVILIAGLLASFSRGPWVGAAAGAAILLAFSPLGAKRTLKVALLCMAIGCAVLISPLGDDLVSYLPFIGSADTETITYRKRLLEISLMLIYENPLTGSPFFLQYMEELRQGQGIIDLVNALATIALSFGLVGLFLFLAAKFTALWGVFSLRHHVSSEIKWTAAGLGASLIASLVIVCTVASFLALPFIFWSLAALAVALVAEARTASSSDQVQTEPTVYGELARSPRKRQAYSN